MENDAALYGGSDGLGRNAGSIEQWSDHICSAPKNWLFFCDQAGKIVGNWSYAYLSPGEEESTRKGVLAGDDFSLGTATYHLSSPDKEVVLYILNMSLNDGYQTEENWSKLWESFGKRLVELINAGITIRNIYANLYREDHTALFRNIGFEFLVQNAVSGDTYCLNLNKPSVSEFGWIIPDDPTSTSASPSISDISFQQLTQKDILTEQQLLDIAGLIYDTDKYISEALFTSRGQAKRVLPLVFESGRDKMFRLGNIFCARYKNRIIGLILRKTGPLSWSADTLLEMAKRLGEELPETVKRAESEYFSEYAKTPAGSTAIINCCVNGNYRMRSEIRLGTHLMNAFLEQHEEPLNLYVLRETTAAMRLYLHVGFKISDECNGFSIDNRNLPCYYMTRPAATDT